MEGTTMKNLTSNLMIAALALTGVATLASAQQLKSEVPFAFRVSGTVMPAGSYRISEDNNNGRPIFRLLNEDLHRPVAVVAAANIGPLSRATDAKLVFRCGASGCALAQIWTGGAWGAYSVPTSKQVERAELTTHTVNLERTR
jgi:hypothetical protein